MRWISSGWTKQSSQTLLKEKSWTLMKKINEQVSLVFLLHCNIEHGVHTQCWAFENISNQHFLPSFLKYIGSCPSQKAERLVCRKEKRNHICNVKQNVFELIRTAWKNNEIFQRKLLYNLHIYSHIHNTPPQKTPYLSVSVLTIIYWWDAAILQMCDTIQRNVVILMEILVKFFRCYG